MFQYESKFQKDKAKLLEIYMKVDGIDEQYKEVIIFLKQFAVVPDHLKHFLNK